MCQDRLHSINANSEAGSVFSLTALRPSDGAEGRGAELLSALIARFTLVAQRGQDVATLGLKNIQNFNPQQSILCLILASSALNRRSFGEPFKKKSDCLIERDRWKWPAESG
jgi:hypothetical protein